MWEDVGQLAAKTSDWFDNDVIGISNPKALKFEVVQHS